MIVTKGLRLDVQGETLFEKVNLVIRSGERVGVMGSSDSDVTAFLKVLAGEVEMDEGTVATEGERVMYVSAEKFSENKESLEFLLAARSSFVFLDIKHLDPERSASLRDFIAKFRGGILIASDDATLMLATKVTRVLEIQAATKTVTSFTGSFADYLIEREKNEARLNEAYKKQQKEKKRLEDWLEEKRKDAAVNRSPQKGSTIRTKKKYLQREILDKEIPKPAQLDSALDD